MRKQRTRLPALTTIEAIKEALDVRLGRRGDKLDAAVTFRDLEESGAFRLLPGGGGTGVPPRLDFDGDSVLPPMPDWFGEGVDLSTWVPSAPTGFTATTMFGGIFLDWDWPPKYGVIGTTEIYRATSNNAEEREFLTAVNGLTYLDPIADGDGAEYFYWIRFVSMGDKRGPYTGPVSASLRELFEFIYDPEFTPEAPVGFTTTAMLGGALLSLSLPEERLREYARVQVFRAQTDAFADAELIADGEFTISYFDPVASDFAGSLYYWVRFVSRHDQVGVTAGPGEVVFADLFDTVFDLPGYEPPALGGLTAHSMIGGVLLEWDLPTEHVQLESVRVLRSETGSADDAHVIHDALATSYFDPVAYSAEAEANPTYYYWVQLRARNGELGPLSPAVEGSPSPFAADVIASLSESIHEGLLATSLREEIARIEPISADLYGPEDIEGTVAHRLAGEREARIAALAAERSERNEALAAETQARVEAIGFESQARRDALAAEVAERVAADTFQSAQLTAVAAAYQSNAAAIYSLEEVRISDRAATATRIDGLEVRVDDNEASIYQERTARANAVSALASQVSILSAKIDALPSYANGFEPGLEFDRWQASNGHTLEAQTEDTFSGEQAALIASTATEVDTDSAPFAVYAQVPDGTASAFSGRRVNLGLAARAVEGGSGEFALGYVLSDGWFSGWQRFVPGDEWAVVEAQFEVPESFEAAHYVVLWGDTSGGGGSVKVDRLLLDVADAEIPEITAQIESMQQAIVDNEQAMAMQYDAISSQFDDAVAGFDDSLTALADADTALSNQLSTLSAEVGDNTALIIAESETRAGETDALSGELQMLTAAVGDNTAAITTESETRASETEALSGELQTLTAVAGDLAADIQRESEARVDENEALAEDVTALWAGVDDNTARITDESRVRASEDDVLAGVQHVMAAARGVSAAVTYSLEEVRLEAERATALRIDGVQVELGEGLAQTEERFSSEVERLDDEVRAVSEAVTTAQSELGDDVAAVQQSLTAEVERLDDSIASVSEAVTTAQSELGDDVAAVQQTLSTEIGRVDSTLVDIGALYTVQVGANDLIGGFGVYNDGRIVKAGFDVDTFWVGRGSADKAYPFSVVGDQVYIDDAVIRNGSIDEAKIGNAAITNAKIANATISGGKLSNTTITGSKIANTTITGAKIADATITAAKIRDAQITNAKIAKAAITSGKIADAAITTAKIGDAQIGVAKIANGAITTAKIGDAQVSRAKISNLAVNSAKIADGAITNAKIANAAINEAKISNAAITNAKIKNGEISTVKISNGAITTAKIGNAQVDTLQLRGQAVNFTSATRIGGTLTSGDVNQGGDAIVCELSFNCTGAPVNVNASMFLRWNGDIDSRKQTLHTWNMQLQRIKNGTHTIYNGRVGYMNVLRTNAYGYGLGSLSLNIQDRPGSGTVRYRVRVFTSSGSVGFACSDRSLVITEIKR